MYENRLGRTLSADERFVPSRFLQRLASVPEHAMREALWGEALVECTPERAAELVMATLRAMSQRRRGGRESYLSLVRLVERRPQARLTLQLAARHEEALKPLFSNGAPVRVAEADELPPPPLKSDRDITLGERRSWARRPDRDLLARLVLDPDPMVIRNLLHNPRLIEQDVLRIVSRRPIGEDVLAEVFHHHSWGQRPAVQLALVLNPYTPVLMAAGLVALLDVGQVRDLVDDPGVHEVVRERAKAALEWRGEAGTAVPAELEEG